LKVQNQLQGADKVHGRPRAGRRGPRNRRTEFARMRG